MYDVDKGFPGPRDDFFDFDVDGRPRGAHQGPKDKDLKGPKAPSMAKDVTIKSPTLGKGTKEPTVRKLQSRKGRKVLRA